MSLLELSLLVFVLICLMLIIYTIPEITEIKRKKIISPRKATFYMVITFILPLIGFILVFPFIRKGS